MINSLLHIKLLAGIMMTIIILPGFDLYAQQSFSNTQYMSNLTPYNPAYSLLSEQGAADALIRKQWQGTPGAPTTFIFDAAIPITSIKGSAAGVTLRNDNFAVENFTEANLFFAKSIQLSGNQYLGVSINAGVRWYKTNYAMLDPNDPALQSDINQLKPNIGFGVMYYGDKFYLGLSVPEFTIQSLGNASVQQNNDFRNHYYFSGAFVAPLSEDISLKPATLVAYSRGVQVIADFSTIVIFKNTLGVGVNVRTNGEVGAIISFSFKSFRFGYSYQFGTNPDNISGFSNATNEITLRYTFGNGLLKPLLF